jgi:hypothetical protein
MKVKLYYGRRSVGQSILVSGKDLGPATNLFSISLISFTVPGVLMWSALSDERSDM